MRLKEILIICLCSVFVIACSSNLKRLTNNEVARKIDEYVGGLVKCRKFTGANLAVVRNGSIILTKGYGLANVRRNESVTPNTKFPIASITKSFTGHLAMKLLKDKQLSIDTKVKDFWQGYTAWSGYRYNDFTLRDFIAHKTGIYRHDLIWVLAGQDKANIRNKIRFLKPHSSPRVRLQYNNLLYSLAGKVIEEIANNGNDWENLIEENFFKPLEMENSGFYDRQENYNGFASPYIPFSNESRANLDEYPADIWKNIGIIGSAGSIVSTANDMAKWLAMILNRGVALNGQRVLPEEVIERVFANEIFFDDVVPKALGNKPEFGRRTSYGLGYWNGYQSGVQFHHHSGELPGFHSTHTLIRSLKSGFYFSTNHGRQALERSVLENSINDIFLGREPTISLQEACNSEFSDGNDPETEFLKTRQNIPNYSELIERQRANIRNITKYTGKYENWAYGTISVKSTGGALIQLSLDYGKIGRFNLLFLEDDTYVGISKPGPGAAITNIIFQFKEEENGKMKKIIASFEPRDPPIFERGLGPEPPVDHDRCLD